MCLNKLLYPLEFLPAEAPALLQPHRVQPEFSDLIVALDVYMSWLIAVPSVEKEAVRANS